MTAATAKQHPSASGGKWCRPNKRLAIYLRDGMSCVWCGKGIEELSDGLTLDHAICWSHGGSNDADNLLSACRTCNSSRGNRTVKQFASDAARFFQRSEVELLAYIKRQLATSITDFRKEATQIIARRQPQPQTELRTA